MGSPVTSLHPSPTEPLGWSCGVAGLNLLPSRRSPPFTGAGRKQSGTELTPSPPISLNFLGVPSTCLWHLSAQSSVEHGAPSSGPTEQHQENTGGLVAAGSLLWGHHLFRGHQCLPHHGYVALGLCPWAGGEGTPLGETTPPGGPLVPSVSLCPLTVPHGPLHPSPLTPPSPRPHQARARCYGRC